MQKQFYRVVVAMVLIIALAVSNIGLLMAAPEVPPQTFEEGPAVSIEVSYSSSITPVSTGANLTFHVTVTNNGDTHLTNLIIDAVSHPILINPLVFLNGGAVVNHISATMIEFLLPELGVGESVTLGYMLTVGEVVNEMYITHDVWVDVQDYGIDERFELDIHAMPFVYVPQADIEFTLTSNVTYAAPGQTITFTAIARNISEDTNAYFDATTTPSSDSGGLFILIYEDFFENPVALTMPSAFSATTLGHGWPPVEGDTLLFYTPADFVLAPGESVEFTFTLTVIENPVTRDHVYSGNSYNIYGHVRVPVCMFGVNVTYIFSGGHIPIVRPCECPPCAPCEGCDPYDCDCETITCECDDDDDNNNGGNDGGSNDNGSDDNDSSDNGGSDDNGSSDNGGSDDNGSDDNGSDDNGSDDDTQTEETPATGGESNEPPATEEEELDDEEYVDETENEIEDETESETEYGVEDTDTDQDDAHEGNYPEDEDIDVVVAVVDEPENLVLSPEVQEVPQRVNPQTSGPVRNIYLVVLSAVVVLAGALFLLCKVANSFKTCKKK